MILAGVRDGFVFALGLGVVFAHRALQFGEFTDHFGEQIGLAQPRGALGFFHVGADQRRQLGGQSFNSFNALRLRPELLVEDDVLELWQPVFKLGL